MKKSELIFTAILIPVDFLMVLIAATLAYYSRFTSQATEIRPVMFDLPYDRYMFLVLIVAAAWIVIFALIGLYNIKKIRKFVDDLAGAFLGVSAGVMGLIIYVFFQQELFSSRYIIIAAWLLSIITVTFGRFAVRSLQKLLYRYSIGIHRVVIVGRNQASQKIIRSMTSKPSSGFILVSNIKNYGPETAGILEKINRKPGIDELIQADPKLPKSANLTLINFCDERKIAYKFIPDLFETQATNICTKTISGFPIIEMMQTPLDGWGQILKRAIDIIGSVFGLIILSPMFLIIAMAIKLNSPGSVFVKLRRVGAEKEFNLYKFRSMIKDAHKMKKDLLKFSERKGPLFKMANDPRVTGVGKFLRKYRLDEFPQLFNVFLGQMSLIGPRPHEPEEVAQYKRHHKKVLAIKPGMSGMAQISGASDIDFEDEVKLDTYYIENWSLKLDLQIFLKTFVVVFKAQKTY